MTLTELRQEVLRFSSDERKILVKNLIDSLEKETLSEIGTVWIKEAERRYRDLKEGKVQPIPHDQFFRDLRQELNW